MDAQHQRYVIFDPVTSLIVDQLLLDTDIPIGQFVYVAKRFILTKRSLQIGARRQHYIYTMISVQSDSLHSVMHSKAVYIYKL